MRRGLLVAAALFASGCGAPEGEACPPTDRLTVAGEPAPFADVVITVATERCGRAVVGRLTWTTEQPRPGAYGYCIRRDGCGMEAWVQRITDLDGTPWDATRGSLAHEIGHWCLESSDEMAVDMWAAWVESEAWGRIYGPSSVR